MLVRSGKWERAAIHYADVEKLTRQFQIRMSSEQT